MKKVMFNSKGILLAAIAAVTVLCFGKMTAKADTDYYKKLRSDYILSDVTEKSFTVDVTKYYNRDVKALEHDRQGKCTLLSVSYACTNKAERYDYDNLDYKNVSGNARKFTINGLKADTDYLIFVKINVRLSSDNKEYKLGYFKRTSTLSAKLKEVNLKGDIVEGVTDTTASLNFSKAIDTIMEKHPNMRYSSDDYSIGFCKYTGDDTTAAYKKAKTMAFESRVIASSKLGGRYTLTGLEPNTKYVVCVLIKMDIYSDEYKDNTYTYGIYYAKGTFKTKKDDDLEELEGPCVVRDPDWEYKSYYEDIHEDINGNNYYCDFEITRNTNSITIDWSKDTTISKANDNTISIGYVEETVFNVRGDKEKYGYYNNFGKNVRDAYNMARTKQHIVHGNDNSYTIKNLNPDKTYAIVIRHGLKSQKYSKDVTYTVMSGINPQPKVNSTAETEWNSINFQPPYMFDLKVKKVDDGTAAVIDWSDASKSYATQKELGKYIGEMDTSEVNYIYYREMDPNMTRSQKNEIYMAFNRSNMYGTGAKKIPVEQSRMKKLIYGLDKDKQYLFAIKLTFHVYLTGGSSYTFNSLFFYDETGENGENYFKNLKKNGQEPFRQHSKGTKVIDIPKEGVITLSGNEVKYIKKTIGSGIIDERYDLKTDYNHYENLYDFQKNGDNDLSVNFTNSGDEVTFKMLKPDYLSGKTVTIYLTGQSMSYFETSSTGFNNEGNYYYEKIVLRFQAGDKKQDPSAPGIGNNPGGTSETGKNGENANAGSSSGNNAGAGEKQSDALNIKSGKADSKNVKYLTKKKNHAWITIDKDNLSASKLKKKNQKVTIGIEKSKGKIKVSNASSGKLGKYIDYKVKKDKVIVTVKKGAKKGTYKLKVTVGAKGKYKKTTVIIKIVVK
ncbi:hypothetical protein [Butyrivibrio sp. AE3004]|uniref:hypothetical protein n=1 Tax=Butyrivibrio sp. AE3004 TaxID=1506994 RepID=UPI0004942481|nr:hypothetical protein [Butyrivibrio sp. AE3004]